MKQATALALLSMLFCGPSPARAQTLVYSFESLLPDGPDGFHANGGGVTITQDTIGATHGTHSLRTDIVSGATFVGALTEFLPPTIGDPPGIDYVLFDLTLEEPITNGFADIGVVVFGQSQPGPGQQFGLPAQFQDTESLFFKTGTYKNVAIKLDSALFHPLTFQPNQSFNQIFGAAGSGLNDLIPTGFQFFINKSNDAPLTFHIDNVRTGVGFPPPAPLQNPLMFSFESTNLGGFRPNGGGVSLSRDTIGATESTHSMKMSLTAGATFSSALIEAAPAALTYSPGVDHFLFDMTIDQPFAGAFANIGITIFGQNGGLTYQVQSSFTEEEHLDGKTAGQYKDIRIDLNSLTHPLTFETGKSFNEIFGTGPNDLVATGFQFYVSKSNDAPVTVYIDNVRAVFTIPEPSALLLLGFGLLPGLMVRSR